MIGRKLIAWYEINKRNLPWRDTVNPYLIWVSEVILQQTRVAQGLEYYLRFTGIYPDVFSLARADIDDVLKVWQGLGYYSRARNMHAAARYIVDVYRGQFPATYGELIAIKGIGDYTAAAIASIVSGQAVPVIDGNVNRVIARLYAVRQPVDKTAGKREIRRHAGKLVVAGSPGTYNQAIMEFGALQCIPRNPGCGQCILQSTCMAYREGLVDVLPLKTRPQKAATRYFHYLAVVFRDRIYIRRRPAGDIWNGLYEFPLIETGAEADLETLGNTPFWSSCFEGQTPLVKDVSPEITCRLTHRILKIRFYAISVDQPLTSGDLIEIPCTDIYRYAVPKVIENYLEHPERNGFPVKGTASQ